MKYLIALISALNLNNLNVCAFCLRLPHFMILSVRLLLLHVFGPERPPYLWLLQSGSIK